MNFIYAQDVYILFRQGKINKIIKIKKSHCAKIVFWQRKNGLILIDNVLWKGDVANNNKSDRMTNIIRDFNTYIKNDERIEKTILPIGDGVTICRKF